MYAIKSSTVTSTGAISSGPSRLLSVYAVCGASAGQIILKDGGATGTTLMDLATPAGATLTINLSVPDEGIRFATDLHLSTLSNVTSLTVLYA